jgi:hypothetical protein
MNKSSERNFLDAIHQLLYELKRTIIFGVVFILGFGSLALLTQTASAAQVTDRSLNISNAVAGQANVTYLFNLTPGTTGPIQSIYFESCTTPVGSCVAPSGLNLAGGTPTLTSGFAGSPPAPTKNGALTSPACNISSNLCINFTDASNQSNSSDLEVTVTGVTNQDATNCSAAPNCTFFVRITTYNDTGYTNAVDSGNVASSTTQTLTVNSIIQEELSFCVGTTNGNSATVETYNYPLPDCSTLSGSSLNLGTLTYADVSVSPVPTTQPTNGDLNNGVLELKTNAYNGTAISYTAVQQTGTNFAGAMRVAGATCSATASFTDQCINSVGATAAKISAGTENFGMTVPGVNCSQTPTIAGYSCTQTAHNLVVQPNYECSASDLSGGSGSFDVFDAGGQSVGTTLCNYAWDDAANVQQTIAQSSAPNGVVPGEALIVEFAATPEVTTPTGAYTAEASYIATPEY